MTLKERKEFLQAIGFWKDFLGIRENLLKEGLSFQGNPLGISKVIYTPAGIE